MLPKHYQNKKCDRCGAILEKIDKAEYGLEWMSHAKPTTIFDNLSYVLLCRCVLDRYLERRELQRVTLLIAPIVKLMNDGILDSETATTTIYEILKREGHTE
tara:strand:+ start:355 stop:660 length:306 start_codon:yes stop_codon:yes gene_type:complete